MSLNELPIAMSNSETTNQLHLPDLSIAGFRGISHASIGRLGRVTLLAGRNGVGKTTVLEAARVYAARGRSSALEALLTQRDEISTTSNEDEATHGSPDFSALFHRWDTTIGSSISIGPQSEGPSLRIEVVPPSEWPEEQLDLFAGSISEASVYVLKVTFGQDLHFLPWMIDTETHQTRELAHRMQRLRYQQYNDGSEILPCESLGPGVPRNDHLTNLWDKVALTEDEHLATDAIRLVHKGVERLASVANTRAPRRFERRILVKLSGHARPLPLRSLGDGATRIVSVAIALANSKNGLLIIDEAENGIHHSVQEDYWRMILESSRRNNTQIIATTHSLDCVTGFARAATNNNEVEGLLVRLEHRNDGVQAVEYSEEDLQTAADQNIEVR